VIQYVMMGGLLLLFAARAPIAIRRPDARPAWIATGVGILGLLSIGVVIPMPIADSWLGGSNALFFFRTALPVLAFWFFRDAVALQAGRRDRRGKAYGIVAMMVGQAVAFFWIFRARPTDINFVDHHMGTLPGLMWAAAYVVEMLWIAVNIVMMLWSRRRSIFGVFILGAFSVIAGGSALLLHCALIFFGAVAPVSGDLPSVLFNVFFYPGLTVIVGGFAFVTLGDTISTGRWRLRAARLHGILEKERGISAASRSRSALRAFFASAPLATTYEAAIELRNIENETGHMLPARGRHTLRRTEIQLEHASRWASW
jgi:hypothetical protein